MKPLNKVSQKLMAKLVEGMAPESSKKIDNAPGAFMALHVERLTEDKFSIAHYYEQNGDRIADPDMELWRAEDGTFYPVALQQNTGHYTRAIEFGRDGKPEKYNARASAELASFATMWLRNIREQQSI